MMLAESQQQWRVIRDSDEVVPTLEELGLSKERPSEWRDVRDAGMPVVEEAVASVIVASVFIHELPQKGQVLRCHL